MLLTITLLVPALDALSTNSEYFRTASLRNDITQFKVTILRNFKRTLPGKQNGIHYMANGFNERSFKVCSGYTVFH